MDFIPILYMIIGLALGFIAGFWATKSLIAKRLEKSLERAYKLGYVMAMKTVTDMLINGELTQETRTDPLVAKPMPAAESIVKDNEEPQ